MYIFQESFFTGGIRTTIPNIKSSTHTPSNTFLLGLYVNIHICFRDFLLSNFQVGVYHIDVDNLSTTFCLQGFSDNSSQLHSPVFSPFPSHFFCHYTPKLPSLGIQSKSTKNSVYQKPILGALT